MRDGLTELLRIGKVSSIDPESGTARVICEDRGGAVSGPLPIIVPFTMDDKIYYMPVVGERVLALFNPVSPSEGFIMGSFYADTRRPPEGDKNKAYIKFKDDSLIEYDKKLHKLTVDLRGDDLSVDLTIGGKVKVLFKDEIKIGYETDAETTVISGLPDSGKNSAVRASDVL